MNNKINYLILLTLIMLRLNGQGYTLYSGTNTTEKGIQLKWYSKKIPLSAKFDVYRQEVGSNSWSKLNSNSIQRAAPLTEAAIEAEGKASNPNATLIAYSVSFLDKPEEWANNYAMLLLTAIGDNKLAALCGNYYLDKTAIAGKKYNYKITEAGKTVSLASVTQTEMAGLNLEPVAGWMGEAGNKCSKFNFSYNAKYPLYKVYRGTSSGKQDTIFFILPSQENIKETQEKKFPYTDESKNLKEGSTYYYAIAGIDYFGNESPKSNEIAISIKDLTPPLSVTGLVASYTKDNTILVKWNKVPVGLKYALLRSDNRKGPYEKPLLQKDTFYVDKQIKESGSFYYIIETESANGVKSYTDTVICATPDITPPAVPTGLLIQSDTGKLILRWNKNVEKDLQGYYLFRALSTEPDNFHPILKMPWKENTYTDILPKEAGNFFVYKICAVDNAFNRSAHTIAAAARMTDVVPPAASVITDLEYQDGKVKLNWLPVLDKDLMSYELYRGTPINDTTIGNYTLLVSGKSITTYTDKNIAESGVWSYYVVTNDSSGNKSKSMERRIEQLKMAEAVEIRGLKAEKAEGKIKLSWNNGKKQKVQLMRKTLNGTFVGLFPPTVTESFEDLQVKADNTYEYKVRCYGDEDDYKDGEVITVIYE